MCKNKVYLRIHIYKKKLISDNEYILHRCTATAELIRRHRNKEVVPINSRKAGNSSQSQIQQKAPNFVAPTLSDALQSETSKQTSSSVYRRTTHMRRRVNGHARRIAGKHLVDTPLKTVNIDVPQNRPLIFKKKSPLPELAHDVSGRKIDSSPHIIIINPIT